VDGGGRKAPDVGATRALPPCYVHPPMPSPLLLTDDGPFLALVERARSAAEISLDCEFHGEKRYRPTLYLVQLGVEGEVAAVDPTKVDLRPLREVLESDKIRKLFHAGREDIRLLARATGAGDILGVFDTQVAAAFLGHGLTVGYARLVKELLGVDLDKSNQFTDWSRELTAEQVDYALNDVRFLPRAAALLLTELERRGRLEWALEASRAASIHALTNADPRKLYRKISGFATLGATELGRLRELAMWRDAVAEAENCRPDSVANDAGLKQLALRPPAKQGQLRGMRGVGIGGSERWWQGLRDAIAKGNAEPEPAPPSFEADPRVESIAQLLGAVRRVVAMEHDVAPDLLASAADLRALAEWQLAGRQAPAPELDVLSGWRGPLLGELLVETLSGNVSLQVGPASPSGLTLVRRGAVT
jgi:ribonuclease D